MSTGVAKMQVYQHEFYHSVMTHLVDITERETSELSGDIELVSFAKQGDQR